MQLQIVLSANEHRLLEFMIRRRGHLCRYEELMKEVWGGEMDKRHVHELVSRIRKKIGDDEVKQIIQFRPGLGVVLMR